MVMMSPQHSIYNACMGVSMQVVGENNTYGYLPYEKVAYPFVFVGEQMSRDNPNKTAIFGNVNQTIHVYHNDFYERWEVQDVMHRLLTEIRKLKEAGDYYIDVRRVNQRIIGETLESQQFVHGILEIEFNFQHKGE